MDIVMVEKKCKNCRWYVKVSRVCANFRGPMERLGPDDTCYKSQFFQPKKKKEDGD